MIFSSFSETFLKDWCCITLNIPYGSQDIARLGIAFRKVDWVLVGNYNRQSESDKFCIAMQDIFKNCKHIRRMDVHRNYLDEITARVYYIHIFHGFMMVLLGKADSFDWNAIPGIPDASMADYLTAAENTTNLPNPAG